MSSATPHRPSPSSDLHRIAVGCLERLAAGVRATAFWSAALLPLVIIGALASGVAGEHLPVIAGALALNAVCAVIGHDYNK